MTILALETSARAASCALVRDGVLAGECYANAGFTHSQTIMPMVEALLKSAGAAVRDVDLFAVSTGPGSFTGLRIGLSAVKGMAMALDKPCAGVSTLAVLAEGLRDFRGTVVPALDARRGQVYAAAFGCGDGAPKRLWPDAAVSVAELGARLGAADGPVLLAGDGAVLCQDSLPELKLAVAAEHLRYQRASCVAALALRMEEAEYVGADDLVPAYLRLPQAQRELNNRKRKEAEANKEG